MGIITAFSFILLDVITGLFKAWKNGKIDSTILRKGLIHKSSELFIVIASYVVNYFLAKNVITLPFPVVGAVVGYVCLMETISFIENVCEVNPQLKNFFKPYFKKMWGENDEKRD